MYTCLSVAALMVVFWISLLSLLSVSFVTFMASRDITEVEELQKAVSTVIDLLPILSRRVAERTDVEDNDPPPLPPPIIAAPGPLGNGTRSNLSPTGLNLHRSSGQRPSRTIDRIGISGTAGPSSSFPSVAAGTYASSSRTG